MTVECKSSRATAVGRMLLLAIALSALAFGCRRVRTKGVRPIVSPSGKYHVWATVNRDNSDKTKYLCLKLHLSDADGNQVRTLQTSASATIKWALGWMREQDTVVLCSSDIGTYAYEVTVQGKLREIDVTEEVVSRGEQLKVQKYSNVRE